MNFDCKFKQFVSEWAIPIEHTTEAMKELKELIEQHLVQQNVFVHFPIEVRFVKKDTILLSPCYEQDVCYIGIIMYRPYGKTVPNVEKYFKESADCMLKFNGKPHWAKELITKQPVDWRAMYPTSWERFCRVKQQVDPQGLFDNEWSKQVFS